MKWVYLQIATLRIYISPLGVNFPLLQIILPKNQVSIFYRFWHIMSPSKYLNILTLGPDLSNMYGYA